MKFSGGSGGVSLIAEVLGEGDDVGKDGADGAEAGDAGFLWHESGGEDSAGGAANGPLAVVI